MALILSGTDGLSDVDGSAATPAIRGTDANTGMFFPAADTIAFAEGGAEIARFDSSGNLGIGIASPTVTLDVNKASGQFRVSDGTVDMRMLPLAASNVGIAGTLSNHSYVLNTNNTERMRITTAGDVGIGASSTGGYKLFVKSADLGNTAGNTTLPFNLQTNTGNQDEFQILWSRKTSTGGWNNADLILRRNVDATANQSTLKFGVDNGGGTFQFDTAGTERMRIDSSGNVGIGTSSPSYRLTVAGTSGAATVSLLETGVRSWGIRAGGSSTNTFDIADFTAGTSRLLIDSSGNVGIGTSSPVSDARLTISSDNTESYVFLQRSGATRFDAAIGNNGGSIVFKGGADSSTVAGLSEFMRIDSTGNLLVGRTNSAQNAAVGGCVIYGNGAADFGQMVFSRGANTVYITFRNASSGAEVGNIQTNGTNTSYVTSSDYRLKENIAPMTGALAKVAQLKPCTYTWKSNGSEGEGFIAHELQEVVPDAVAGEKDAVDSEGNIKAQGIDTSFLVATLTAAIQEQQALINDLTTRLTALENK
jgi:hypothetical protein